MSKISAIYMKSYNKFIVLDNKTLNSSYIQLFVLENYNKKYFEPVILSPYAKVYKLKI
jgi:dolichyl-diphosphooligosaccharide--protein glycosyltransferase/undecaprenyl-diphosphooligosaccharide--protein glycosyltransferase